MLILGHIIIALTSIAASTFSAITPSRKKLNLTYGLILLTVMSGAYLVVSTHSPLLGSCITGLIYLTVALSGALFGRRKLAAQKIRIEK